MVKDLKKTKIQVYLSKLELSQLKAQKFNEFSNSESECVRNAIRIILRKSTVYV